VVNTCARHRTASMRLFLQIYRVLCYVMFMLAIDSKLIFLMPKPKPNPTHNKYLRISADYCLDEGVYGIMSYRATIQNTHVSITNFVVVFTSNFRRFNLESSNIRVAIPWWPAIISLTPPDYTHCQSVTFRSCIYV
jgi:hypothetical protein